MPPPLLLLLPPPLLRPLLLPPSTLPSQCRWWPQNAVVWVMVAAASGKAPDEVAVWEEGEGGREIWGGATTGT